MAHECPECGQTCHCGGDIDDCLLNFEKDIVNCTHWKQCDHYDAAEERDYEEDEAK